MLRTCPVVQPRRRRGRNHRCPVEPRRGRRGARARHRMGSACLTAPRGSLGVAGFRWFRRRLSAGLHHRLVRSRLPPGGPGFRAFAHRSAPFQGVPKCRLPASAPLPAGSGRASSLWSRGLRHRVESRTCPPKTPLDCISPASATCRRGGRSRVNRRGEDMPAHPADHHTECDSVWLTLIAVASRRIQPIITRSVMPTMPKLQCLTPGGSHHSPDAASASSRSSSSSSATSNTRPVHSRRAISAESPLRWPIRYMRV